MSIAMRVKKCKEAAGEEDEMKTALYQSRYKAACSEC